MLAYVDDKDVEKRQVRDKCRAFAKSAVFAKCTRSHDRGFVGCVRVGSGLCVAPMSCVFFFRRGGGSLRPTC